MIRDDGGWQIEPTFDEVGQTACGRVPVRVRRNWGVADLDGRLVIEPRYDRIWPYTGGAASVQTREGDWLSLDIDGHPLPGWRGAPREGRMRTCLGATASRESETPRGGLWGFLDAETGAVVAEPTWALTSDFVHGLAWVQLDGPLPPDEGLRTYAYVDLEGRIAIEPFPALRAGVFSADGLARILGPDRVTRFINRQGRPVIDTGLQVVSPFREGLALARADSWDATLKLHPWGFVDPQGEPVIELAYNDAKDFSEDLAAVRTPAGWGFIDRAGNTVIEPRFGRVHPFHAPLTAAQDPVTRRWGLIDRDGDTVVAFEYREIAPYGDGVARFWHPNGDCGLFDPRGQVIADGYHGFEGHTWPIAVNRGGRPSVSGMSALGGTWGFLDTTGREVFPCTLALVLVGFHDGFASVGLRRATP